MTIEIKGGDKSFISLGDSILDPPPCDWAAVLFSQNKRLKFLDEMGNKKLVGTVTSINPGNNIVCTPDPITGNGSIALSSHLTGINSFSVGTWEIFGSTISSSSDCLINGNNNISITSGISILLNADTKIRNNHLLQLYNSDNTFYSSFSVGPLSSNISYTLPSFAPTNGQVLSSNASGIMSWVTATTGTVTSIAAGSNLTGGVITASGTIALSNNLSGLSSITVGNLTLSGNSFSSSGVATLTTVGSLTLTPTTNTVVNSPLQIRSNNALVLFNSDNSFSTSLIAGAQTGNISYTMPTTAPVNGQVLSSLASGVMSWITASSGSVTTINTSGLCSGGPISTSGTVTVAAATQADLEASASTTTCVTPAVVKYHPGVAKAWVKFSATGGSVVISASYNVTSVTRNNSGDYTVNFTTPFSSANYASSIVCGRGLLGTGGFIVDAPAVALPTASAFRFTTSLITLLGLGDTNACSAIFFGDQ